MFNIAGHLIYWGDAIVIFPLSETNMYAIAPNVPTERNNTFAQEFEQNFPGHNLLEVMFCYKCYKCYVIYKLYFVKLGYE